MKPIFTTIFIAVTWCYVVNAANSAKYVCKANAVIDITGIVVDTFSPKIAYGDTAFAACKSGTNGKITGDGLATGTAYKATVANNECGMKSSNGVNTVKIIVGRDLTAQFVSDIMITFACDGTKNNIEQTAKIDSVSGDVKGALVPTVDASVALTVEKAGAALAATGTLGDDVNLVMTVSNTDTAAIKKCKVVSCMASDTATFTVSLPLIKADGCTDKGRGVFTMDAGFTTQANPPATTAIHKSPEFKLFKFYAAAVLHFKCTCEGCTAAAVAACNDVACPVAGRRRRRAVSSSNSTIPAQTVLLIVDKNSKAASNNQEGSLYTCLNHVSFISVVAILALLLLVSLAVSVFFCGKLLRQKEQGKSGDGYPNQAYKA